MDVVWHHRVRYAIDMTVLVLPLDRVHNDWGALRCEGVLWINQKGFQGIAGDGVDTAFEGPPAELQSIGVEK